MAVSNPLDEPVPQEGSERIRIATWNIQFGRRLPLILEGLETLAPFDLLALQELSEHRGKSDAERIAEHLGAAWRSTQKTAQVVKRRHQANGFVWNTERVHPLQVRSIALPTPMSRALRSLAPSRRNAVLMDASIAGRRLRIYSVHLDIFGVAHKQAQFSRVIAHALEGAPRDATLIAGDLNTFGWGGRPSWQELHRLASAAGFEDLTAGIGWTHRQLGARQKLDAIFASPRGIQHRRRRCLIPGSDHIPLWLELSLEETQIRAP